MGSHNEGDSGSFSNGGGESVGSKRYRRELESFTTVIGSKYRPCTKFFSTSGCPFGEGCHFLHHIPGGLSAVTQMTNPGNPSSRNSVGVSGLSDHGVKIRMCNKVNTEEGCRFGDKCRFGHGERELGRSSVHGPEHYSPMGRRLSSGGGRFDHAPPGKPSSRNSVGVSGLSDHGVKNRMCNKVNTEEGCRFGAKCRFAHSERELGRSSVHGPVHYSPMRGSLSAGGGRFDRGSPGFGASSSFGASALAKISVDASLAGAIIGIGGINAKNICRVTGARLSVRDHKSDPNLKNVELEGTFDQIKDASSMVRELIIKDAPSHSPAGLPRYSTGGATASPANSFKAKPCDNFVKGSCRFGDRCHFAHGA